MAQLALTYSLTKNVQHSCHSKPRLLCWSCGAAGTSWYPVGAAGAPPRPVPQEKKTGRKGLWAGFVYCAGFVTVLVHLTPSFLHTVEGTACKLTNTGLSP